MKTVFVTIVVWLIIVIGGTMVDGWMPKLRADCTGCAPGKGYEHLFTADGKPIAKAISPRKFKWSRHR